MTQWLDAAASDPAAAVDGGLAAARRQTDPVRGRQRLPVSPDAVVVLEHATPRPDERRAARHGVATLPRAERTDLDAITFQPTGQNDLMTWEQSLAANFTDGIVVLHRGRVVYERYFGVLDAATQHLAFSVTKSFVATIAGILAVEGALDDRATRTYLPELKQSGFADATIAQLLDMTTGMKHTEDYVDDKAGIWELARAGNFRPRPADYQGPARFTNTSRRSKRSTGTVNGSRTRP